MRLLRGHSIITWTRRREGVGGLSRESTLGHLTKSRYYVKCSKLSTRRRGEGQNWLKFGPRSC